jgi:tRNA(fMet)-specific endonuclease VapC
LSYIAKAQTEDKQVEAYKQLKNQLMNYCAIPVIEFDLDRKWERQIMTVL